MIAGTERTARGFPQRQVPPWPLLSLGLVVWIIALTVLHSAGQLSIARAAILLVLPLVIFGTLVRPAWVVIFLAASPIGLIEPGRSRPLILLLVLTLIAQLIQPGSLSLLPAGFLAFAGSVVAAFLFRFDLTGDIASFAGGFLNGLVLVLLLGWVAYNATRSGELKGKPLTDALLLGLILTLMLNILLSSGGSDLLRTGAQPLGRKIGYLAAMGFSISFARLLISTGPQRVHGRAIHVSLAMAFAFWMSQDLLRGAWLSATLGVFLIAVWAGRRRYWLLIPAALVLILAIPVARERVLPGENVAVTGEASLVSYTTGRWDLWGRLWQEVESGLPLGHGFGYTFSLSSEDLFGAGSESFTVPGSPIPFVYPHNDFLFWMVDLGLLGLFGMVLLWAQLIRAFRAVSRSGTEQARHVHVLGGILITIFVAQAFDNTFTSIAFTARFFIVAGFVFGSHQLIKIHVATPSLAPPPSRSVRDSA